MAELLDITLSNGKHIKGHSWPCENGVANFVFITGMQEYSLRYEPMAQYLNSRGINVWIVDQLGQGANVEKPEDQQIVPEDSFAMTVEGVKLACDLAKANGLPTTQGGHSMGSFITQARLERYPHASDRTLIIGSNGGQAGLMKMGSVLASMVTNKGNWTKPSSFLTSLSLGGYSKSFKGETDPLCWLSVDVKNKETYAADPWCGHPNTHGFWKEFLKGMKVIWTKKALEGIAKDEVILITSGSDDPVGQKGKGVQWLESTYKGLGIANVTLKLYEGYRHEIHNEEIRETVYSDWANFILG